MPNPWEPDFPTEEQPYFEYQERERPWAEAQQQWELLQPDPWEYGQGRGVDPGDVLGYQANWAEDSPADWLAAASQGDWAEGLWDREEEFRSIADAFAPDWAREDAMDRNFVRNALEETRERALPWINPMFRERFMNQPLGLMNEAAPGIAAYYEWPRTGESGRPATPTGTLRFSPAAMPDPEVLVHEFAHSMDLTRPWPLYSDVALDAYPNAWGQGSSLGIEPYATGAMRPRELPEAVRPLYPWLNMGYYAPRVPTAPSRLSSHYTPFWRSSRPYQRREPR